MFHKLLRIVKQNCQNSKSVYVRSGITPELKPPLASLSRSFHYLPPKKLGKAMFSGVSVRHSVYRGDPMWPLPMMYLASLYRASPPVDMGDPPSLAGESMSCVLRGWYLVVITGDLFKLVHWTSLYRCPPVLTCGGHRSITVGKRAVGILLECFLVLLKYLELCG